MAESYVSMWAVDCAENWPLLKTPASALYARHNVRLGQRNNSV